MKYLEIHIICKPNTDTVRDVLAASLSDIGFETFVETNNGMLAYVQESLFSENKLAEIIGNFILDAKFSFRIKKIEDKNWNEEWEKNYFQPIVINDKCIIYSSFHHIDGDYDYRILIDPKMSFGTGHHQTTGLILEEILKMELHDKTVLDMGCGTAVLAILASMRGAKKITAIDIDEWAYSNALENIKLNNIQNVSVYLGGAELLGREKYDVIFANINRNILLQDIPVYSSILNMGGHLIMSGFYVEDISAIQERIKEFDLKFNSFSEKENWVAVVCQRE